MALLDEVKVFAETLRPKKMADKVKANRIKQFILDKKMPDGKPYSNATKSSTISNIKKYLIPTNYFTDKKTYDELNVPDLYNEVFKQRQIDRDENKVVKDISIEQIKTLINLADDTDDPYQLLTWLLLTCGLRLNEVISNKVQYICINKIKVDFISKKNPDENTNDNIVYLLVPATKWIAIFNKFQSIIKQKGLDNPHTFSKGVKRILQRNNISTNDKSISAHSLRKLYLTYQLHIKKFEPDKLPSVKTKKLLNHSSEATSVFYTNVINITGELKDVIKNDKDYNKMKITDIKKILKDCNISFHSKLKKAELIALIPV
jgi:integrase